MDYNGRFSFFDAQRIRTYDLKGRESKVSQTDLAVPDRVSADESLPVTDELKAVAEAIVDARAAGRPVIVFTGAHLIKNGFGPLLIDLVERNFVTLVGVNGGAVIHDLELALVGKTSENVPHALPRGEFGFAEQTGGLINGALIHGEKLRIGAGEALGRMILGEAFPDAIDFPHRASSLLARALEHGAPVTMHAAIGTDIIDQFPNWNPSAKGGCSGRDFRIFCSEVEKLAEGGVFANIGSAVLGPEVFLKACSMCANVGHPPRGVTTANFDIRPMNPGDATDERSAGYYARDIKSVIVRIPEAFGGRGHYVQGDHLQTVPALYRLLVNA